MKTARRSQGFPVDVIENHRSSQNQLCFETTLSIQETHIGYSKRLHEIWVYRANQEFDFIAAGYSSDFPGTSGPATSGLPLFKLGKLFDTHPDTELADLFSKAESMEKDPVQISEFRPEDLFEAISERDEKMVLRMIQSIPDTDFKDRNGNTLLMLAILQDLSFAAVALIERSKDINVKGYFGQTALHEAARQGNVEIVKLLIDRGADINIITVDRNRGTALHDAALKGNMEIVKMLIEKGSNVNATNKSGGTVLAKAISSGNKKVVELVLDSGGAINVVLNEEKVSHLLQVVKEGKIEIAELLIARGADVTCADFAGRTPLHEAVDRNGGLLGIATLLLEKGAKVDARSTYPGQTPLHAAVLTGNKDIVQLLLKNGADPNAVGETEGLFGSTVELFSPLKRAKEKGHKEVVEMLRAAGAKE
jgi:ankyrin repeat protein